MTTGDYLSYDDYSNFSGRPIKCEDKGNSYWSFYYIINGLTKICSSRITRDGFNDWQLGTLDRFERFKNWGISEDKTTLTTAPGFENQFQYLKTYGAEITFSCNGNPCLEFAKSQVAGNIVKGVAFAWQAADTAINPRYIKTILDVSSTDPSESRIADVSDVKKIGNGYYFAAAVGGYRSSIHDYVKNYFCATPTLGLSDVGCYRLKVYKTSGPLESLRDSKSVEVPNNLRDYNSPSHEYARFYFDPSDNRVKIAAKYVIMGDERVLRTIALDADQSLGYPTIENKLAMGQNLRKGDGLRSANGEYVLEITNSGMSVRKVSNYFQEWQLSKLDSTNPVLSMQTDGNLVFYPVAGSGNNVWATYSFASDSVLELQNDGNLVLLKNNDRSLIWSAFKGRLNQGEVLRYGQELRSPNNVFVLEINKELGLRILRRSTSEVVRTIANVAGSNPFLTLQGDGHLVFYKEFPNYNSAWATGIYTGINGLSISGSYIILQDDGNLVQYNGNGTPLWYSGVIGK